MPLRFLFPQYTIICDLAYKLPIFRARPLPQQRVLRMAASCLEPFISDMSMCTCCMDGAMNVLPAGSPVPVLLCRT